MEFGVVLASTGVHSLLDYLHPEVTELEPGAHLDSKGLPLSCRPMIARKRAGADEPLVACRSSRGPVHKGFWRTRWLYMPRKLGDRVDRRLETKRPQLGRSKRQTLLRCRRNVVRDGRNRGGPAVPCMTQCRASSRASITDGSSILGTRSPMMSGYRLPYSLAHRSHC